MLLRYTDTIASTPHLVLEMNLCFPPGEKQNNARLSCGLVCFSLNAEMVSNRNSVAAGAGPLQALGPIWRNRSNRLKTGPALLRERGKVC